MLKVGLTGGYATGKSFVASELANLGCFIIYADELGHRVLEPGGEAYALTVDAFGPGILASDGAIDRKKLAAEVFGRPELLERLSSFVHPAVLRLLQRMLDTFQAEQPRGVAVIEAAILIETGTYKNLDRIVLTVCSEETQIARAMKRDHLTRDEVLARIRQQMPVEEKMRHAHYVVNTDGLKEETARRVRDIHSDLKALAESRQP